MHKSEQQEFCWKTLLKLKNLKTISIRLQVQLDGAWGLERSNWLSSKKRSKLPLLRYPMIPNFLLLCGKYIP